MHIVELEKMIMQTLLADLDTGLLPLRTQYAAATVILRDFTGVGIFTTFYVPASAVRVVPSALRLEAFLTLEGVEHGATAVLFVRAGRLDVLEVVTLAEDWPEEPVVLSIMPIEQA